MSKKQDIELIFRNESIASGIVNAIGAFVTFFYLNVIDPAPTAGESVRTLEPIATFIFIAIFATFFISGIGWGNKLKSTFKKWVSLIESGEKSPADVPQSIKRDVLNFPLYAAGIAVLMWLSSSLIAAYITWSYRVFIGLLGWGGLVAVTLLYFVDDLLWRPIIPIFFPDGNLRAVKSFHLPILWKLLIVFLFTGILLPTVLVNLSWQRAQTLLYAPNPELVLENLRILQIFILSASVVASVGLAFFITRGITNPLKALRNAMERVQEDNFDVRVVVTTNDELGYLGERFNQMTSELQQKEMLRNVNSLLREQTIRDSLTGVFNRRYMMETLEKEIFRSSRSKKKLSVVMLDIDKLKEINDKYGHVEGGDQSLKEIAKTLQNLCRHEDTICRYAGDEFVVILYDTSASSACERALEWKETISKKKFTVKNKEFGVTFSAGVVEYSFQQISAEELLQCADHALYQAKEAGRDQVMIYSDAG